MTLLNKIAELRDEQVEEELRCNFIGKDQNCSFQVLNQYHQQCGFFSTNTSWLNIADGFPLAEVISADTCKLPEIKDRSQPAVDFHDYVYRHKVSHIAIFGDSQGRRYFFALKELIHGSSFTCRVIKFEKVGFVFGLKYFIDDVDESLLLPVNRTCQSCASALLNCTDSAGYSVLVEYISMIMNSKSVMMANKTFCIDNRGHALCSAASQQEYVFQHYFNKRKYPELLLMFTTFAHDRDRAFAGIDGGMRHLLEIIDEHVPPSSSIIWYSTTPFHEKRMNPELRNMVCENGYDVNQKIHVLNHMLFNKLKPRLQPREHKPSMYGFFDLFHLQEDLNQTWALDWVHSQPPWYQYILGYTFRLLVAH